MRYLCHPSREVTMVSPPYSTRNVEFCRSPNADEVIDYTTIDDMSSALCNKGVRLDRIVMPIGISALMHPSRIIIKARRCVFQVSAEPPSIFLDR